MLQKVNENEEGAESTRRRSEVFAGEESERFGGHTMSP